MATTLLIINPHACSGRNSQRMKEITDFFAYRKKSLDVAPTQSTRHATELAKKARKKYKIVIAAGGDGTINEVINGLAGGTARLGIIPIGTENVLAYELGVPTTILNACDVILAGRTKTIDLGLANKRYFVLMAGIGFDAQVASQVRPELKKMLGSMAYPLTGLGTLFRYKPQKLFIKLDNQVMERTGYFVVVGNAKYYGRVISLKTFTRRSQVTPYADISDGYLDVCIFKNTDLVSMFRYVLEASIGNITTIPHIEYFKAKHIHIRSGKEPVLAHVDCEVIGTTPQDISVAPQVLKVIVP